MKTRQYITITTLAAAIATIAACASTSHQTDMSQSSVSRVQPPTTVHAQPAAAMDQVARGKYLILISGCNDCHTPGWEQNPDHVPMNQWLTGTSVGYKGPWGVTYAPNLRRIMARITPDRWVHWVRHGHALPPMPWASLQAMNDRDLKAIYAYVRTLKPLGPKRPHHVQPGQPVHTPYIDFEVQQPKAG